MPLLLELPAESCGILLGNPGNFGGWIAPAIHGAVMQRCLDLEIPAVLRSCLFEHGTLRSRVRGDDRRASRFEDERG